MIFNIAVVATMVDFALTPWTGGYLGSAVVAVIIWGVAGWAQLVPLQDRLIKIAPDSAQLSISLNSCAVFIGASLSGPIGAAGLKLFGARYLGVIGAAFFAISLMLAQVAYALISRRQASAHGIRESAEKVQG